MLIRKQSGDVISLSNEDGIVLSMEEKESDGGICMTLKGKLVSESAHLIQDELEAFISIGLSVNLNLKDVTYISPSVMFVLLNAQMLTDNYFQNSEFTLRSVPAPIYQSLYAQGITDQLMIED